MTIAERAPSLERPTAPANPALLGGAALAAGWLLASLAVAQEPGAQERRVRGVGDLSEIVEVTVVNVDVYARDRAGRAVPGLTARDFKVFDNDKPVEVSYFSSGPLVSGGDQGSGTVSEQLSLIFFIDDLHLSAKSRDKVLPELKRFAEREMKDGHVFAMAVSFNGNLHMLQDLTPDYFELAQGLNRAEVRDEVLSNAKNLKRRSQESFVRLLSQLGGNQRDAVHGLAALETTFSELLGYCRVLQEDALDTLDGLQTIVDSLALVPGRKALIYVSDGFAMRPFDRLVQNLQRRVLGGRDDHGEDLMRRGAEDGLTGFDNSENVMTSGSAGSARLRAGRFQEGVSRLDMLPHFLELVAEANSNRISIYGLKPPDVEVGKAALGERVSDSQSLNYLSDLRAVLHLLSKETGGLALVSGSDVAGFLDKVSSAFQSYYSLGYVLDDFVEGSVHQIRVKPQRRAVRLRYRTRYVARSLKRMLTDRTSGALLLGWIENHHDLRVDNVAVELASGGLYDVKVTASMPLGSLTLVPSGGIRKGQVRLVAAVMTEKREMPNPRHIVLPLEIPVADWEEAKDRFFAVSFDFSLPRGSHKIAIGLWDESSGTGSFIRRDLAVRGSDPEDRGI